MQKKRPKSTTFFTKKHCFDAVLAPFSEYLSPQIMANTLRNKQLEIHGDSDRCFKKIFFENRTGDRSLSLHKQVIEDDFCLHSAGIHIA